MTNNKIQLEVCKAMLNSNRMLAMSEISDEIIGVTLDGFIAYALNKNECIFNTDKISKEHSENMKKIFEPNEEDKLLTATRIVIEDKDCSVRKLTCKDFDCYIKESLYKQVSGFILYGYGSLNRILATDDFGFPRVVVMPRRLSESKASEGNNHEI